MYRRIRLIKTDDVISNTGLMAPEGAVVGIVRKNDFGMKVNSNTYTKLKVAWFSSKIPTPESFMGTKRHSVNVSTGYLDYLYGLNDAEGKAVYDALFRSVVVIDLDEEVKT